MGLIRHAKPLSRLPHDIDQRQVGCGIRLSASLRSGSNDIRFVLPTQLFKSLRTKSSSNLLALTSVSPSGTRGLTVTRRVLLQAPKKPKRR